MKYVSDSLGAGKGWIRKFTDLWHLFKKNDSNLMQII